MSEKLRRFPVPFRPMPKPALGEALLTEPETKLVVDQDLDGMACPAAKDEHTAGEGIAPKALAA